MSGGLSARRGVFVPLLVLLACDSAPPDSAGDTDSVPIIPRDPMAAISLALLPEGQPNLLVPIQVGIDATTRRAFVSSNGLPTLAEVNLDLGVLEAVHDLGEVPALHPLVAPASDGAVWLGFEAAPALQRFVPGEGLLDVGAPFAQCHALVALPGGGVAAAGRSEAASDDQLVFVAPGGALTVLPWTGTVMAMAMTTAGLAVLRAEGAQAAAVLTLDPATGAELGRCGSADSGIAGGFAWLAGLDDGGFAFASTTTVSHLACPSGEWSSIVSGRENRSVVPLSGGEFLVLDRLGGENHNWGFASRFDSTLTPTGQGFETGKNSGYGALDPATGLLWMNSEGTGELWAMDTFRGEAESRVELGAHVESLAVDPNNPDRVVYGGRLSTEIGVADLRSGTLTRVDTDRRWPVSPVFLGERLFYLDDLTGEIVEIDRESLADVRILPSALGPNSFLTLADMVAHAERGTLFVSGPESNEVAEVDPDSGAVLGRWTLSGQRPRDPDQPGRLELVLAGGGVVAVRNNDGVLSRIDPDASALAAAGTAHAGAVKLTVRSHQMDAVERSEDGASVWLSSGRIAADTLMGEAPIEGVDHVLADEEGGARLVWEADARRVAWLIEGAVESEAAVPFAEWGAPALAVGGEGAAAGVALGTFDTAVVSWVPLPHP